MSDTEQLFIVAGVWTAGAVALAYVVPKWPAKIATVVLLVAVPFWELPYGYFNFLRLCEKEGGLRVFEKIAPQQTVCANYPIEKSAARLLELGIVGVEAKDQYGETRYISREPEGASAGKKESAQYCINQSFVTNLPWRIQRNEHTLVRISDQHLAARYSDFVWFGTWWQQDFLPVLGRGGECRHGDALLAIASALAQRSP